jgi:hypothetical protein
MINFWTILLAIIFILLILIIIFVQPFGIAKILENYWKFFSTSNKFGWGILLFIIYITNLILVWYFNPLNIASDFTKTFILLSIFTGLFNILVLNQISLKKSGIVKFLAILFLLYSSLYTAYYFIVFTPWPLTFIISILNILLVIGLLAAVYEIFSNSFFSITNVNGKSTKLGIILALLINLIFYVPCLFIDLIAFIKDQYKITTKPVAIILLIEIIIIVLRFLLPYLYNLYNKIDGHLLKKGPIYLNEETNLGNFQNIKPNVLTKNKINYNYALSSWIWINPQPASTSRAYNKSTLILNYGDILYIYFNKNKLVFYASSADKKTNSPDKKVKIFEYKNIQYQKWNNIIFNYDGGTLDIFINNNLVASEINITPVLYFNTVISGEKNGINGGIKNIMYYDKVLTKNDIYTIYNIQ